MGIGLVKELAKELANPHQPMAGTGQCFQHCLCGAVRGRGGDGQWEPWHVCPMCWTGLDCQEGQEKG